MNDPAREYRGAALARIIATGRAASPTHRWVEHPFGVTRLPGRPRRVVSIGLDEHDLLLHLGIVPLLVRDVWGEQPSAVWPWSRHLVGAAMPETFTTAEPPLARIRALEPDLIVATWEMVDEEQYAELSSIAPTLPNSNPTDPWSQPWDDHFLELAAALGQRRSAQAMIDGVWTRIIDIAEGHPHWRGMTAASLAAHDDGLCIDVTHRRGELLSALGFGLPAELTQHDDRCVLVHQDAIGVVDRDLVVWVNGSDDPRSVVAYPGRTDLRAHREGREVYLDKRYTAAFSVQSPLSLHFLLDLLVPEIEAAVDGRPHPPVSLAARYGVSPPS